MTDMPTDWMKQFFNNKLLIYMTVLTASYNDLSLENET